MSTLDVLDPAEYPVGSVVLEDAPVPTPVDGSGYAQTKWVGEQLVQLAGRRGFECRIYRLPILGSHSATGVVPYEHYWFTQALRASWILGKLPDWPLAIQALPVDYAAQAILKISRQMEQPARAFHLTHPTGIGVRHAEQALASLDRKTETVSLDEWTQLVQALANETQDQELEYLSTFLLGADVKRRVTKAAAQQVLFDSAKAVEALRREQLVLPSPVEMVASILKFLARTNRLQLNGATRRRPS
jgi:thioester reductase-like protein